MEPWMIDMLAGNGGGSHDLEMHGTNAGGSHDVQVVETQYGSPQEEQVFREARQGRMMKERAHFSKTRENGLVWEPGMHPYIDVRNVAV